MPLVANPIPSISPIESVIEWPEERKVLPPIAHYLQAAVDERPGMSATPGRRLAGHACNPPARPDDVSKEELEVHNRVLGLKAAILEST